MSFRSMGAFNGMLPQPTGMVIGFIRDPKTFAYLQYAQLVAAPEIDFTYWELDPDMSVRLVDLNEFGWGYDDRRPTGESFKPRYRAHREQIQRWDFPYTVGQTTLRVHDKSGIDVKRIYDATRASHAALHRACRVVAALQTGFNSQNTATLQDLIGSPAANLRHSSGEQYLSDGTPNPNFQILKKMLNRIKQRLSLATNGVVNRADLMCVFSPNVAQEWSESGECFEALKQSQFAKQLGEELMLNSQDWNIPARYAGFNLVVEDTPRVFINEKADGTIANVNVPSEKDYILGNDDIYCVSRPGGLDGNYGFQNFSSIQIYHYGGEARIEAFEEPKHQLIEGHVVLEDKVVFASRASAFRVTNTLPS